MDLRATGTSEIEVIRQIEQQIMDSSGDMLTVRGTWAEYPTFNLSGTCCTNGYAGVRIRHFTQIMHDRAEYQARFTVRYYSASTETLRLAICTPLHERLYAQLELQIKAALVIFGLPRLFFCDYKQHISEEGAEYHPERSPFPREQRVAEADASCGKDRLAAKHLGTLPEQTLHILSGVVQTTVELQQDMDSLLRTPGEKRIVLLVKGCPKTNWISIEKWRQGSFSSAPSLDQTICIWQANENDSRKFRVSGGPLKLELGVLFQPLTRPEKGYLVIGERMLEEYADRVWNPTPYPRRPSYATRPR